MYVGTQLKKNDMKVMQIFYEILHGEFDHGIFDISVILYNLNGSQ